MPVALDMHEVVTLHPGDRLRHRRPALLQPLGYPSAERGDAFLFELIDRPQIHLGGIDQVAHGCHSPLPSAENGAAISRVMAASSWGANGEHSHMATADRPAIWWVRRDFRLSDNPALRAAVDEGGAVLPVFVLDPVLLRSPGKGRGPWMRASLDTDLRSLGGPGLTVVHGKPSIQIPRIARQMGAQRVHISADFAPYGGRRDATVEAALADIGVELKRTGSPYAVAPGTMHTDVGQPFQVFSPFHRAWLAHGVRAPAPAVDPDEVTWIAVGDPLRWKRRRTTCPDSPAKDPAAGLGRSGGSASRLASATTDGCTTFRASTPHRTCRSPCAGVISIHGPCWPTSLHCARRGRRPTRGSSHGA